jgi:thienamycin biosynthesis protein ThnO
MRGTTNDYADSMAGYSVQLSNCSGLPTKRITNACTALARDLDHMQRILGAQAPMQAHHGARRGWVWAPAGRNIAVRIPGNFPTTNITWLMALAARRPVILCTSLQDPFTAPRLVSSLYAAGLPDDGASLCHHESEGLWKAADQVLVSGSGAHEIPSGPRVRRYHDGHSKAFLSRRARVSGDMWRRLAHLAVQGSGRICTNLSALLVEEMPIRSAHSLARALAQFPVRSLVDVDAVVPAFPDRAVALRLADQILASVARGALDVSERVTGMPLVQEIDGWTFLRPTVLLLDSDDPLFGAEFPFPFVTVTEVPPHDVARICRGSLIVSVIGDAPHVVDALLQEPKVDKVFVGDFFDRGYVAKDPHEGFVTEFLFFKKAFAAELNKPAQDGVYD